jgi:hypothetical protein
LTYALLSQVASQVQDEGNKAFRELKTSHGNKFPLERDSQIDLTRAELVQAASLLNKVRLQERFGAEAIGEGVETGVETVDQSLAQLRGIQPPPNDAPWFAAVEQLFQSLPRGQEPYYCRVTLLGAEEQERLGQGAEPLLLPFFRKFRLVQGTDRSRQLRTSSPASVPVDDMIVKYPGPALLVEFYRHAGDAEPSTSVAFPEPWPCLRMLRQSCDERKKGCVKLNVKGGDEQECVFFVLLQFFTDNECTHEVDMPTLDQWPSLKQREQ